MESYVNEVMSLFQELTGMGKAVDNEFIGTVMLQGLPSDYESMVMALESLGALITSDFVKSKLLHDSRWGRVQHSFQESKLLNRRNLKHRQLKCWRCGEVGHTRPACLKKLSASGGESVSKFKPKHASISDRIGCPY
jgi:hypothetical protein